MSGHPLSAAVEVPLGRIRQEVNGFDYLFEDLMETRDLVLVLVSGVITSTVSTRGVAGDGYKGRISGAF
jgi:hypothetical protein